MHSVVISETDVHVQVARDISKQLHDIHNLGFVVCDVSADTLRVEDSAHEGTLQYALYSSKYLCANGEVGLRPTPSTTSAPEVLHGHAHDQPVPADPAQDMFSFGVTLAEAATGITIDKWGVNPSSFQEVRLGAQH